MSEENIEEKNVMKDNRKGFINGQELDNDSFSEFYELLIGITFDNIDNLLLVLGSLKKKIFFAGNCGILYKDVIKSYLKNDIFFEEDTLVSSKYVGLVAFDKFSHGDILSSNTLNALYLKKSNAEETLEAKS